MRRVRAVTAGTAAIVALGTTAAFAASAALGEHSSPSRSVIGSARAQQVATSLADSSVRDHYQLPHGTLVSATVCVRTSCVTKHYAPAPICTSATATCIGTALVTRRYPGDLTITVELA